MLHAETPSRLQELVDKLILNNVKGVLISGGFNREGYLPVEPFLPVIKYMKEKHGLVVSIHTGLAPLKLVEEFSALHVDVVDYEFTLDQHYVNAMRGLKRSVDEYLETLDAMLQYGLNVVPHIPIGLTKNYAAVKEALLTLYRRRVNVIVLIININSRDPHLKRVLIEILRFAREILDSEISLGCMRPYWLKKEIDKLVVRERLVDRVANPNIDHCNVVEACCSIPRDLLPRFSRTIDR